MARAIETTASPRCFACGGKDIDFGPGLDSDIVRCVRCGASLGTVAEWLATGCEIKQRPRPMLSRYLRAVGLGQGG